MKRTKCTFWVSLLLILCSCDNGFQKLEAGEYGVKFAKLPTWAGGGVQSKIIQPGEKEFIMPWEDLYRVDTTIQSISWGARGRGNRPAVEDSVQTRTVDGNEVLLAITVQYHVDPKKVMHIIQNVAGEKGLSKDRIRILVSSIARADVRTHMNVLSTRDFFSQEARQQALDRLRKAMNARLNPEGIIIDSVIYNDHRFERVRSDGSVDDSYQQKIDQTQATNQETEQEIKRINVVVEEKKILFNEEQARVNRELEEAKGRKERAVLRGDSYFEARKIESERIEVVGMQEVEGLKKRIDALSGPGGKALLKMEIAEALVNSNAQFVLVNESGGKNANENNIGVQKTDTNELLRQVGIIEGLKDKEIDSNQSRVKSDAYLKDEPLSSKTD
ncbi:MAG TPA: SPFH domain-containing protein [Oligoflexia bacterium]|nr:SPFH domain-containing protein [Oligoflexia bacterium]HMP47917.1 SPFH domain-containing protein [Oligoflexia bacterium]